MKINKQQAELLAKEVIKQLEEKKKIIPSEERKEIEAFLKKYNSLNNKYKKLNQLLNNLSSEKSQFTKEFFNKKQSNRYYLYDNELTVEKIYSLYSNEKLFLSDIRDKILLESMFTEEKDFQKFIDDLVQKFSKK